MREREHGDRVRRLAAVMRFVAQIRDTAGERELIESLVQATAVWYDLDARGYRRGLDGRYELAVHLPGADVANDPATLDLRDLVSPNVACRVASLSELEQLGWRGQQTELLLLPVATADTIRWILALPGTVDADTEDLLLLVCRTAGGVMEQQQARRTGEIASRLRRRMTDGRESFQARARGLAAEVQSALSAGGVRVSVRAGQRRALTLAAAGGPWESVPPAASAGAASLEPGRLVFGLPLGNDGVGILELLASPGQRFGMEQAAAASSAADVVGCWLSGVTSSAGRTRGADGALVAPPFEREIQTELDRARRLSLKGGVLVASVPGKVPDPGVLSAVIQAVRSELRSSDLLGQLTGGDIAAVLVRTSNEGVATAAVRVRQRLDAMARERRLPAVVIGHAMYPGTGPDSPSSLVERARRDAGLTFSN